MNDKLQLVCQYIVDKIEIVPGTSSLELHFNCQIDVLDRNLNTIRSETVPKATRLTFNGIGPTSDVEAIADKVIAESGIVSEHLRSQLVRALAELRFTANRPCSTTEKATTTPKIQRMTATAPSHTRGTAPSREFQGIGKRDLDLLLSDAINVLHAGDVQSSLSVLTQLVELVQFDKNLLVLLTNQALINSLCSTIQKFSSISLPVCIQVILIFERFSLFKKLHPIMGRFKIGFICLNLVLSQIQLAKVAQTNLSAEDFNGYVRNQNALLRGSLKTLYNIADDVGVIRKMTSRGLSEALLVSIDRKDYELKLVSLKFIRRIIYYEQPTDEEKKVICSVIVESVFKRYLADPKKALGVIRESIEILALIQQSPGAEILQKFSNEPLLIPSLGILIPFLKPEEVTSQLIGPIVRLAMDQTNVDIINSLVQLITEKTWEVVFNGGFFEQECIQRTIQTHFKPYLSLYAAVLDFNPEALNGYETLVVTSLQDYEGEQLASLLSVAARLKMTNDLTKKIATDNTVIECIKNSLQSDITAVQAIEFISSISLFSVTANALNENKIDQMVIELLLKNSINQSYRNQGLLAIQRFVCHTKTRETVLRNQKILDLILTSASQKDSDGLVAISILEAIETFQPAISQQMRALQFAKYNSEWLLLSKNFVVHKKDTKVYDFID